jgi:hypothetical protein
VAFDKLAAFCEAEVSWLNATVDESAGDAGLPVSFSGLAQALTERITKQNKTVTTTAVFRTMLDKWKSSIIFCWGNPIADASVIKNRGTRTKSANDTPDSPCYQQKRTAGRA